MVRTRVRVRVGVRVGVRVWVRVRVGMREVKPETSSTYVSNVSDPFIDGVLAISEHVVCARLLPVGGLDSHRVRLAYPVLLVHRPDSLHGAQGECSRSLVILSASNKRRVNKRDRYQCNLLICMINHRQFVNIAPYTSARAVHMVIGSRRRHKT